MTKPSDTTTVLNSALAGRYTIEREIGVGGMATVYLARDVKHARNVALKVLNPDLGAVLGVERFLSEIRVTANLQHPNLLPLFDSGEAAGLLFYVMPFVDGESLRTRLDRERQLPIDEAVRISSAVASALDYAHRHGVIHRDLKPENILMHEGQPLVADFGIALAVSNAGGQRVTQTGLSLGTPQYMSPEQATGDRVIDARTDVYSLAAVTYEMLTGEPPHSGTSAQAIIAKLMTTVPQPVRTLRPSVPANVAMAVECGLSKLPADRFSSAKGFADALVNPAFTTTVALSSDGTPPARRRTTEIALAAACVVLLLSALAGWLRRAPEAPVARYAMALDSSEALISTPRWGRIALSPDGSKLVYVGGRRNGLMLRRRDELHATMIAGTEQAGAPTFSPDGNRIAFVSNASILKIVALDGTPPVVVSDSAVGIAGLSWGEDGMIYDDAPGFRPLVRFRALPNALVEHFATLDSAAHELDQTFPELLPGGNGMLYTSLYRASGGDRYAVVARDLAGKTHRVVVDDAMRARYVEPGFLLYVTSAGNLLAARFDPRSKQMTADPVPVAGGLATAISNVDLAVSRSGTLVYVGADHGTLADRDLVWAARDGKVQPVDTAWRGNFADLDVSRDGQRLALSIGSATGTDADIWIKDLDKGPARRLTVEGGNNRYPVWSPNGKSIYYASRVNGQVAVLVRPADGSAMPVVRVRASDDIFRLAISPDETWLVAQLGMSGPASRLGAARLGIDSVLQPLIPGSTSSWMPALSPDGKWLAYVSAENGTREVYVVPFPNVTSAKWALTRDGGILPVWSPRGTEIFYRDGSSNLVAAPVSTTPTFSVGTPVRLFSLASFGSQPGFLSVAVASDGRFLIARSSNEGSGEHLTIVENWARTMTKKK